MKLGCIADDFTGATDLANNLVRSGMRSVQTIGVPEGAPPRGAEAVVVALKSRTIPAGEAVAQSLAALRWLREHGARQIYFKVCSTFDSTDRGNIGPVTEALMDALGCDFTIACPAFPANGRTVYKGYLFTGDVLLSEGSMRDHPLTPMTDPSLVRVMQRQCSRRVGLIEHTVVRRGSEAIAQRMAELKAAGVAIAIVDALDDADLHAMGRAFAALPVLTAGSGVAIGLPANFGLAAGGDAAQLPPSAGARAIVSGSCSAASNAQVAAFLARHPQRGFAVDPLRIAAGDDLAAAALDWAGSRLGEEPLLVYATSAPESVKAVQAALGVEKAGALVERTLAQVAAG
ncbi:MAG: 3-oxo-tetronate kinase, partial [Piscinibacter sp.]|uniref:3-oxo-tetronate kinase n=1 Tax=Piscinibacter sp. TaxID=1903157 RepID=UPI003D0E50D3